MVTSQQPGKIENLSIARSVLGIQKSGARKDTLLTKNLVLAPQTSHGKSKGQLSTVPNNMDIKH
ncbi:hypothetical protein TUM19329_30100 [Legionella antarctica]|uniref:Uncharacterized protein n=1 Tax=Legionella antarctica TaxID=2708020 RepID=A0A6F8T858_9GAMM|nr:hypothetical protein TUM19329_30100 [Legionella antarctica]